MLTIHSRSSLCFFKFAKTILSVELTESCFRKILLLLFAVDFIVAVVVIVGFFVPYRWRIIDIHDRDCEVFHMKQSMLVRCPDGDQMTRQCFIIEMSSHINLCSTNCSWQCLKHRRKDVGRITIPLKGLLLERLIINQWKIVQNE